MADDEEVTPRIESGSIVFGSDWPGLFVRGDDAFNFALHLEQVLSVLDEAEANTISVYVIRGLLHDLKSVDTRHPNVARQQLRSARECLARTPTIPGPPSPDLEPGIDLEPLFDADPDVEITIE